MPSGRFIIPRNELPEAGLARLESELARVRWVVIRTVAEPFRTLLETYALRGGDEAVIVSDIVTRATESVSPDGHPSGKGRAFCPLCHGGSNSPHFQGYTLDSSLSRHLQGWGSMQQCDVLAVASTLAREAVERKAR